jgi:hypothetical protein
MRQAVPWNRSPWKFERPALSWSGFLNRGLDLPLVPREAKALSDIPLWCRQPALRRTRSVMGLPFNVPTSIGSSSGNSPSVIVALRIEFSGASASTVKTMGPPADAPFGVSGRMRISTSALPSVGPDLRSAASITKDSSSPPGFLASNITDDLSSSTATIISAAQGGWKRSLVWCRVSPAAAMRSTFN